MKKKFIYVLITLFIISFLTGCDNQKKEDISQNNTKKQDTSQDNQKQEQTKDENIKTPDKGKKADEDMLKFSKPYLDTYDQEENAFIELSFKNKDFLPKDLFEKAKLIKIKEKDKSAITGYKLIISCEDNVLFRVSYNKYQEVEEHFLDNFYMSKGDFFIIELNESQESLIVVDAYKNPNRYAHNTVIIDIDAEELFEKGEVLHDVFFWQRDKKASIFTKTKAMFTEHNTIYRKNATVDLNGDNKEERVYFWGEVEHFVLEDDDGKKISKRLVIDEYEIPLDKLSKENTLPDIEEFYEEDFSGIEIIDINPNDKYKEILLTKVVYGPSTFLGKLYHFEDGEMKYIGTIEYFGDSNELLSGLYDNKLKVKNMGYIQFNYISEDVYEVEGNKLVKKEDEPLKINSFYKRIVVYLNKELNLYEKIESNEPMERLKIGDQIIFLETDGISWIKVKSSNTGKTGYLKFTKEEENDENYNIHFNQQEELKNIYWHDIFSKLPMWG